jgi:membrane-associated phospholipid phosphatase
MSLVNFPAYGYFPIDHTLSDSAPTDWRSHTNWLVWRAETVALLNQLLWPSWDAVNQTWQSPNQAQMLALTMADLSLLRKIQLLNLLERQPQTPVSNPNIHPQITYFIDEDRGDFAENYAGYDTTLDVARLQFIQQNADRLWLPKLGDASLQFKYILQRPRPYQVAFLLGKQLTPRLAFTSMTGSLPSGHALEGCLVAMAVFDHWLTTSAAFTLDQITALAQWGVDVGDRRVLAGVHFPSDNLASWLITLRLADKVFANPAIPALIAKAITTQSAVFKLISTRNDPAHQPALDAINTLAASYSTPP